MSSFCTNWNIFLLALAWNQRRKGYFPVCVGVLDFPDNSILVFNSDNRSVESKNFHRYIVEFFILPEFTIEYAYHHLWNVSSKQASLFPSRSSSLLEFTNAIFRRENKEIIIFAERERKRKELLIELSNQKYYIFLSKISNRLDRRSNETLSFLLS